MEILDKYLIETIAFIVILILIIMYFLIRKPKQTSNIEKEVEPQIENEIVEETPKDTLAQKVSEPEFVIEESEIKPVEEETPPDLSRVKREVVPHAKIHKDDFEIFKGARILVAEDNLINQKVITSLLATSGIEITMASDGQIALDILKDNSDFALILMDAHMPNIDGFQATRIIRKNPDYDHIPVIALSGDTAADDIKNMFNVGMEKHLEKPLRMDNLYDILYMYSSGDEGNTSDSTKSISKFDIDVGLDICGGDKDFYLEILNDFMSKYSDSASKLQEQISNKDAIGADKMLLDISGVAANIGANHLHETAIKLKGNIATPEDMEYINNLQEYKRSLKEVCDSIAEYKHS